MDFSGGPAELGGIMLCVALGAWALGHRHGHLAVRSEAPAPVASNPHAAAAQPHRAALSPAPAPCQDAARDERRVALAAAPSLGEVHAEITAYRRAEAVFAMMGEDVFRLAPLPLAGARDCRFLGLTGEPTCGASGSARADCAGGIACTNAAPSPRQAVQVSPAPDVLRV